MKTLQPEDVFVEQIPIECLKVPHIEDDAMTLRNRPLIEGTRADHTEQCIASPACVVDPFHEPQTDCDAIFRSKHWDLPVWW